MDANEKKGERVENFEQSFHEFVSAAGKNLQEEIDLNQKNLEEQLFNCLKKKFEENNESKINQTMVDQKMDTFKESFFEKLVPIRKIVYQFKSPSAKSIKYELFMSSKYPSSSNTYEALQTDDITQGAGTNTGDQQYIEARFPHDVLVRKITLAGAQGMAGGWSNDNLNGRFLQYSKDGNNWIELMKIEGVPNGLKTFEFEPVVAKSWRIFNKDKISSGHTGTGVFRLE